MEKRATPYTLLAETLWSKWLHPKGVWWTTMVIHSEEQGLTGEGAWSSAEFHGGTRQKVLTLLDEGLDLVELGINPYCYEGRLLPSN